MEIDLGPEAQRFRDELRQWLEANRPEGLDDEDERAMMMRSPAALRDWTDRLHRGGLPLRRLAEGVRRARSDAASRSQ